MMSSDPASSLPAAVDPLPRRFLTSQEGIGGIIKQRPEDFLVEEQPLYQPSGSGEHLYLFIEKQNVSHGELMSCVRRHFGVPEEAIGFAGMKDKAAITRQTLSVRWPINQPAPEAPIPHERIRVLWIDRHRNKLRRGHLAGNRFSIRIRQVDPLQAPRVRKMLADLAQRGVPDYFGSQRFGYRRNNHLLGALLLRGQHEPLVQELLGSRGSFFPEYQRERRELFDAGKFAEAAAMWTPSDRAELLACRALAQGRDERQAVRAIGRPGLQFWISAVQSAIFNRVLDHRIEQGLLLSLIEGDLAWKHDSHSVFRVTSEELAGDQLQERVARLELSPSGPMWGLGMMRAQGRVDEMELAALRQTGLEGEHFLGSDVEGLRRPLRGPVISPEVDSGIDEHGGYIRVAFDLPRGAYATVVLRELMKNEDAGAVAEGD